MQFNPNVYPHSFWDLQKVSSPPLPKTNTNFPILPLPYHFVHGFFLLPLLDSHSFDPGTQSSAECLHSLVPCLAQTHSSSVSSLSSNCNWLSCPDQNKWWLGLNTALSRKEITAECLVYIFALHTYSRSSIDIYWMNTFDLKMDS